MTEPDDLEEPDFAEEHSKPTYADEHADAPGAEPDESTPDDPGGGMDPRGSQPV